MMASKQEQPKIISHVISSPDALLSQLEKIKLSDEDTEVLLDEAYALNKKLKEELKRQEAIEMLNDNKRPSAASSSKRRPQRLPPLHVAEFDARLPKSAVDLYSTKQSQPKKVLPHSQSAMVARPRSRHRSPSAKDKQGSPTRTKVSSAKKKERKIPWDDRFSYN